MKKPLNIGHRGAMGHETENTLASIQKALDIGVDMIEIDVYLIKSGEVVVFHDDALSRLSNSNGNIEDLTLDEVKKIVLNGNHHIPTLEEAIDLINNKVPINIELKGKNTAKPTFALLENYYSKGWKKEDFIISSFLWNELEIYRKLDIEIPIAILIKQNALEAIPIAKKLCAQAINPWFFTLTPHEVYKIQQEGFKVYTYTVNEPQDIHRAKEFGVDGIFCNFPERLH